MKRLALALAARSDLTAIARYSELEWGRARKRLYLAAIRDRFSLLRRNPHIGAERGDIGPGYRSLIVGRHVIFYRIEGEDIFVALFEPIRDVMRNGMRER